MTDALPLRCAHCGDQLPGTWQPVACWGWCDDCRAWWLMLTHAQPPVLVDDPLLRLIIAEELLWTALPPKGGTP